MHESAFLKGTVIGAVVCHFAELGIYAAILVKQTKIEAAASSVYIVKNNQHVSTRRAACVKQRGGSSRVEICILDAYHCFGNLTRLSLCLYLSGMTVCI